jgi:type IV secretory pathway VirB2 component (pilin)
MSKQFIFIGLMLVCLLCLHSVLMATNLPWDGPLQALDESLGGKTGKTIAVIGLFVSGGLLLFGAELSDFARRMTWLSISISLMLSRDVFLNIFDSVRNGSHIERSALIF